MANLKSIGKELTTTNLDEIKALAEELLDLAENAESVQDKIVIENDLEEVIGYYNANAKAECFAAAKDSGDPMKYAISTYFYKGLKVSEHKDKDTKLITRSIDYCNKQIDLAELHKKLGGIGANTDWIHTAQTFNFHLTARAAEDLGSSTIKNLLKNESDVFSMSDIARQRDLGKNPTAKANLAKTLQIIITEMLGDGYEILPIDVNYLTGVYASDDKKSKTGVTLANHKTLRTFLKKVCYRVMYNLPGYDVVQKEIKIKEKAA